MRSKEMHAQQGDACAARRCMRSKSYVPSPGGFVRRTSWPGGPQHLLPRTVAGALGQWYLGVGCEVAEYEWLL
jgi:hypothetical protein